MDTAYRDAVAEWYANRVREGGAGDWAFPVLFELLGEIQGEHICDLGCGEGRVARLLAQRGAKVVGIDLSPELIQAAQAEEAVHPLGIHYRVDDAHMLGTIPDATCDGVVCVLALMDIPQLDATFRAVWRVLRPAGWFVFTITHPCFAAPEAQWRRQPDGKVYWEICSYFTEGFWHSQSGGESLPARRCAPSHAFHVSELPRGHRFSPHTRGRTAGSCSGTRAQSRSWRRAVALADALHQSIGYYLMKEGGHAK